MVAAAPAALGSCSLRARIPIAAVVAAACALAVPGVALGVVATLASPSDATAQPSCPGTAAAPCTVVSRTTAMQVKVGDTREPLRVSTAGRIVGWKITLSRPTIAQIKYFDATEGGTARAQIAVIHNVSGLGFKLEATSPVVHLEPYFGQTATFALTTSIPVGPGDIIALDVPTWVPALELHAGRRTAWRASRSTGSCSQVTAQTAQTTLGSVAQYDCIYPTALVSFGAVEISTP